MFESAVRTSAVCGIDQFRLATTIQFHVVNITALKTRLVPLGRRGFDSFRARLLRPSVVEYISAALLFSKATGILISDAAALIAFSNSSWLEVIRCVFVKRPGKQLDRRICKRAVLALFPRVVVIAIDLIILGLSIPRPIDVYERYVGSTAMAFRDIGVDKSWVHKAIEATI